MPSKPGYCCLAAPCNAQSHQGSLDSKDKEGIVLFSGVHGARFEKHGNGGVPHDSSDGDLLGLVDVIVGLVDAHLCAPPPIAIPSMDKSPLTSIIASFLEVENRVYLHRRQHDVL